MNELLKPGIIKGHIIGSKLKKHLRKLKGKPIIICDYDNGTKCEECYFKSECGLIQHSSFFFINFLIVNTNVNRV